MKDDAIRKTNRKALPVFLLVLAGSMAIGGVAGYGAAKYGLDTMAGTMKAAGALFGTHIAPWLMLVVAVLVPVVCLPIYKQAGKLAAAWDGEEEEVSDAIDRKLSIIIWVSSAALVFSYFLIAASYSGGFAAFDSKQQVIVLFIGIAAFFGIMAEAILIQQKCVDTVRQTNPEKKASVYDMQFQKKWMDSCDEAEKIMIGKCAYKAYSATNVVCTALSVVLAICSLVLGIGFLPSFAVCLIWLVNLSVYCKEAMRYSKAGTKIS